MKKLGIIAVALVASSAITACGKTKPLTAEQRTIFNQTTESAGRTDGSAQTAKSTQHARMSDLAETSSVSSDLEVQMAKLLDKCEFSFDLGAPESSLNQQPTSHRLAAFRAIQDVIQPNAGSMRAAAVEEKEMKLSMKVGGTSCPMKMDWMLAFQAESETKLKFSTNQNYAVVNEEFRKLNDVDSISLSGSGEVEKTGDKSGKAEMSTEGKIHSQSKGDIAVKSELKMEGDDNSGSGEMKMTFEFPDFNVELKIKIEVDGKKVDIKYTLNGEEVTEKEVKELFSKGGKAFQSLGGGMSPG